MTVSSRKLGLSSTAREAFVVSEQAGMEVDCEFRAWLMNDNQSLADALKLTRDHPNTECVRGAALFLAASAVAVNHFDDPLRREFIFTAAKVLPRAARRVVRTRIMDAGGQLTAEENALLLG